MSQSIELLRYPELIFAIAGPIGVDIDEIKTSLENALKTVKYTSHNIKLTEAMRDYPVEGVVVPPDQDFYSNTSFKMDYANALCKKYRDASTLAAIAIREIMKMREEIDRPDKTALPEERTAYIIRQLKRPDEVSLLRRVYGRQFVLISAYGTLEERTRCIEAKLRRDLLPPKDIAVKTRKLIERDASEDDNYGQQLSETYHLADVFIDGIDRRKMDDKLNRFIQAFFGRCDIAPSKEEYGMYAAKSASLRSSDLSRQIGAAIFTHEGEIIAQGCNEVPKAFGGTYWDLEEPDFRDVRLGQDPNEIVKKEILRDLFDRLKKHELLSEKATAYGDVSKIVDVVTRKGKPDSEDEKGALVGSSIMDLTEYGRVVHAEMCAICDAARLGRSVKGAILYCTTFPCHNCAKHILASGITKVVYMEPYPKSRVKDLHRNEIELEKESQDKVSFVPFFGISPYRYRDIFQKSKRKREDGSARRWNAADDSEQPMIEVAFTAYFPSGEDMATGFLVGDLKQSPTDEPGGDPAP